MHAVQADEKIGLALSGGGFRASFFHIGVLARLAELGILRRVQVISTVSGGSIVGAAYYIRVKNLLEEHDTVSDGDYVELVRNLEQDFREAVRKNIRARVWRNPVKNLLMARPSYSRSDRIGDLYDRYFYKPIWKERDEERRRKWRGFGPERPIELRELAIDPLDPNAVAPSILINATSLNTGHNWRFEAKRMGEPLAEDEETRRVMADIDANERLAQGYFDGKNGTPVVADRHADFAVGLAVAASACVPMLFHPLSISGMYGGIRVQLVDGGVHDNQGVQALFDENCTHLIVSDASGQMGDVARQSSRIPAVAFRSMGIYGDRVRDEQLVRVAKGTTPHALMHLRKGVAPGAVQPDGRRERPRPGEFRSDEFGVAEPVQAALSRIRTDLDAFSDVEAYSLTLDGYLMTDYVVPRSRGIGELCAADAPPAAPASWPFGAVAARLAEPDELYMQQLEAASRRFLKPLALSPMTTLALLGQLVALVGLIVWWQRGAIWDGLHADWTAWMVVAAAGGTLLFGGLYLAADLRLRLLRLPVDILSGSVLPALFALPLVAVSWGTLAVGRLHLLLGRVPPEPDREPETASLPLRV